MLTGAPTILLRGAEASRTPAAEGAGPIDMYALAQGRSMLAAGVKTQTLTSRTWNLDRIDQRDLPLNQQYQYGTGGAAAGSRPAALGRRHARPDPTHPLPLRRPQPGDRQGHHNLRGGQRHPHRPPGVPLRRWQPRARAVGCGRQRTVRRGLWRRGE